MSQAMSNMTGVTALSLVGVTALSSTNMMAHSESCDSYPTMASLIALSSAVATTLSMGTMHDASFLCRRHDRSFLCQCNSSLNWHDDYVLCW